MDRHQENQYRMMGVIVPFLADRANTLARVPAARQQADEVRLGHETLAKAIGTAVRVTAISTVQAETAEAGFKRLLPALLGPLQAVASDLNDVKLLTQTTLTARQIDQLRPEELSAAAADWLAQADTLAEPLVTYGLTEDVRRQLRTAYQAFAVTVGRTKTLLNAGKEVRDGATDQLADLMQQLYKLDRATQIFRVLDPDFHRAYRQARRVGRSGGGKGPAVGAGETPPQA
ncbi:MAG: hypothetical protein H7Z21_00120 [Hymenobacter sp.]|nr:hypothetical protein [Hymenobacter sp.]